MTRPLVGVWVMALATVATTACKPAPPARAAALTSACDRGDAHACGQLAALYMDGTGVAKDPARGLQLFEQACGKQDAPACATLATAYKDGLGVAKDLARAAGYAETACDLKYWQQCFLAGALFKAAVPPELVRAAALFDAGCGGGIGAACMELAVMRHDGVVGAPDEAAARALLQKACDLHEAAACDAVKRL